MATLTIRLTDEDYVSVKNIALRRNITMNAVITQAVSRAIRQEERDFIDAQFAEMDDDLEYQALALAMCEEFKYADADAGSAQGKEPR